jgi:hypothetical protein
MGVFTLASKHCQVGGVPPTKLLICETEQCDDDRNIVASIPSLNTNQQENTNAPRTNLCTFSLGADRWRMASKRRSGSARPTTR